MTPVIAAALTLAVQNQDHAARIDSLFAQWDSRTSPGCAVGAYHDGHTVLARGYGMADLAHDVPITDQTVFNLASLTKQFTAYAVALLVESGDIDPDATIDTYLAGLPAWARGITVRHLLYHTSGLRDQLSMASWTNTSPEHLIDESTLMTLIRRQRGLNNVPGTAHLYSNTNYYLLARIVARVSGVTFAEFVQGRIFEPHGMQTARMLPGRAVQTGLAEGYRIRDGRFEQVEMAGTSSGDGGALGSVRDILAWEAAHFNGASVWDIVRSRGSLADGSELAFYGWGNQFQTYRGAATEGHGGTWGGFRVYYLRLPEHRFAAAVLCNQDEFSPFQLTRRVIDVYLGDRLEPLTDAPGAPMLAAPAPGPGVSYPSESIARFVGRYHSDELDVDFVITAGEDAPLLRIGLSDPGPMQIIAPDTLGYSGYRMVMRAGADGRPAGFTLTGGRVRGVHFERAGGVPLVVLTRGGMPRVDGTIDLAEWSSADTAYISVGADEYVPVFFRRAGESLAAAFDVLRPGDEIAVHVASGSGGAAARMYPVTREGSAAEAVVPLAEDGTRVVFVLRRQGEGIRVWPRSAQVADPETWALVR